jgi:hypothetical protein
LIVETHGVLDNRDIRIQSRNETFRRGGFSRSDIIRTENNLSLKIGKRHMIVVDDADGANAGGGEILDDRRAETARADYRDPRCEKLLLALAAHFAQEDMAGVAFELGSVHILKPEI